MECRLRNRSDRWSTYAAEVIPDCGVGSFCSAGTITRKEMAKFLLLAKNGASYSPPACANPIFSDVPPTAMTLAKLAGDSTR